MNKREDHYRHGPVMNLNTKIIGQMIRKARAEQGITQRDLALTSGTGTRFISDLENGKPSCRLDKTLTVLDTLGIEIQLISPPPSAEVTPASGHNA